MRFVIHPYMGGWLASVNAVESHFFATRRAAIAWCARQPKEER